MLIGAWFFVAPPTVELLRPVGRPYEVYTHCTYGNTGLIFACIIVALDSALVLSGVKMQWTKIREKDPLHFDECKEMRVSMTLFTVFFIAFWPLLFYFASPHELIKLSIIAGFSFIVMAGCMYIVIWPKVYIGYFDPDSNTLQTDAYKNTGTSAEKMTEKEEELFLKCSMLEDSIVRKDKQ